MAKRKYKVLSLFSGAMGLDLGLEATGRFKLLACIEKEKVFCNTIRKNKIKGCRPKTLKIFENDICNLCPKSILESLNLKPGDLDLLVGGPPCQTFSTVGRRQTIQDPRGTLLWQFLKFIDVFRPKLFLMENVRGILSAAIKHRPIKDRPDKGGMPLEPKEEPGSVVKLFSKDLQSLNGVNYHMDCFEVNSVNYGAPQIRERVLFIGNRFNAVVNFPNPTHTNPRQLSQKQSTLFDEESSLKPWTTLRDAIGNLKEKNPLVLDFSPRKKGYLSMVPEGANWRSLPLEIQKESMGRAWYAKGGRSGWWRRLTFDLPCPTLMTMPNHASTSLCHPTETRALSIKEYARIQEFPDDWVFVGKVHEQYTQVGNAVPTRLGRVAGNIIAKELDTLKKRKHKPYKKPENDYRIIYIQSHVRTRKWFEKGKVFVWDRKKENKDVCYKEPIKKTQVRLLDI
ncbi:DNA cytosine methyltransferase [Candidatus Riflebacteria bacterium]